MAAFRAEINNALVHLNFKYGNPFSAIPQFLQVTITAIKAD